MDELERLIAKAEFENTLSGSWNKDQAMFLLEQIRVDQRQEDDFVMRIKEASDGEMYQIIREIYGLIPYEDARKQCLMFWKNKIV